MTSRYLFFGLAALLVAILLLARARMAPATADDAAGAPSVTTLAPDRYGALGIRVRAGEGALVPPDLVAAMQAWPEAAPPADPAEVELGRLLFFDPLLSRDDTISCATCHHPDLGFSDGRERSVGASGTALARSAPSLWNVAFRPHLTWDGRADSLQDQMLDGPLFHPDEMASEPDELLRELQTTEGYARRFEALYGEVTLAHMADAIAAFQRTLVSRDSAFDRYVAGDFYALTGAQRRGVEIFRDPRVNCVACHELPLLATDEFKVIGVGDGTLPFDAGRGAITGRAADVGAFSVPTLRNVALSAPYMHNGIEPDLNGAISFYLNGGGDNLNLSRARLDPDLRPFDLPTRSLQDLEAFLLALTDESARPAIPDALPSGLDPVAPVTNPAREAVREAAALPPGPPRIHTVEPGGSIQAAIDRARPGDTVEVAPGRYHEALDVDVEGVTIRGEGATLVGRPFTPVGVTVRHNNVTIVGLTITDFPQLAIDVQGARGTRLERVTLGGRPVTGEIVAP